MGSTSWSVSLSSQLEGHMAPHGSTLDAYRHAGLCQPPMPRADCTLRQRLTHLLTLRVSPMRTCWGHHLRRAHYCLIRSQAVIRARAEQHWHCQLELHWEQSKQAWVFPKRSLAAGRNGWPGVQSPDKQQVRQTEGYFSLDPKKQQTWFQFLCHLGCPLSFVLGPCSFSLPPGFPETPDGDRRSKSTSAHHSSTHRP